MTANLDKGDCESWGPVLTLAAREVFETMLGSVLEPGPTSFAGEELDITSMVGLAGQIRGVVTLRCATNSATLIAAKMLGVETAAAGPQMCDAVGEVCNMIAGNFKNKINGMGDGCMLSVPTIITGADYLLRALTESSRIDVNLMFEGFPLIVSLEIHF
ncbi:MAG TPA: chemotaxis protein CheX [Terriglobales bacterium]|nr:chemotaxis protein CheX [Terriglobales bacterium]